MALRTPWRYHFSIVLSNYHVKRLCLCIKLEIYFTVRYWNMSLISTFSWKKYSRSRTSPWWIRPKWNKKGVAVLDSTKVEITKKCKNHPEINLQEQQYRYQGNRVWTSVHIWYHKWWIIHWSYDQLSPTQVFIGHLSWASYSIWNFSRLGTAKKYHQEKQSIRGFWVEGKCQCRLLKDTEHLSRYQEAILTVNHTIKNFPEYKTKVY